MARNVLKLMKMKKVILAFVIASLVAVFAESTDKKVGGGRVNAGEREKVTVEVDGVGSTVDGGRPSGQRCGCKVGSEGDDNAPFRR